MSQQYQGHLSDGSSVQKHSAGGCYPFIIFAKQDGEKLRYCVMSPDGSHIVCPDFRFASKLAAHLKAQS